MVLPTWDKFAPSLFRATIAFPMKTRKAIDSEFEEDGVNARKLVERSVEKLKIGLQAVGFSEITDGAVYGDKVPDDGLTIAKVDGLQDFIDGLDLTLEILVAHLTDYENPHQTTADQVVPDQTGNAGKVLKTDGSNVSWGEGATTSTIIPVDEAGYDASAIVTGEYLLLCDSTDDDVEIILPPSADNTAKFIIKKTDAAHIVFLTLDGSDTVDDDPSPELYAQNDYIIIISTGTGWVQI